MRREGVLWERGYVANRRIEKSGNEKLAAIDVQDFVRRKSEIWWREPAVRWSMAT